MCSDAGASLAMPGGMMACLVAMYIRQMDYPFCEVFWGNLIPWFISDILPGMPAAPWAGGE